ncbi:hypothetical protein ACNHE5_08445 [Pandoraea pnomenusa]|uniref:hypothetical protein n=1 Tax=Pandoraea pnomenusa TaxID=93220 RepID=UPI003CEAE8D7
MTQRRTTKPSRKSTTSVTDEPTGTPRLYKRFGVRKVTFWYKYPDGRRETIASAPRGDRAEIARAAAVSQRRAMDIIAGQIIADSVGDMIDRFRTEIDPTHYADQSKAGIAVRKGTYERLTAFFGRMQPAALEPVHGYQYLDARAKSGAPKGANKEMALMSTICNYGIRWGLIRVHPFRNLMLNKADTFVRDVVRSQVIRFYLWSVRQEQAFRTMGVAGMFTYLTGFRAAEVRPYHMSGLSDEGVMVVSAKRKMGESETRKLRKWSPRLRVVVERAKRERKVASVFLFPNRSGRPYTKSGWNSVWQDAMYTYIGEKDAAIAEEFKAKKAREAAQRRGEAVADLDLQLTKHPEYFSLLDIRPAAITSKLEQRAADAYDFAAHTSPSTTHRHYDRRKTKVADATE